MDSSRDKHTVEGGVRVPFCSCLISRGTNVEREPHNFLLTIPLRVLRISHRDKSVLSWGDDTLAQAYALISSHVTWVHVQPGVQPLKERILLERVESDIRSHGKVISRDGSNAHIENSVNEAALFGNAGDCRLF